MGPISVTVAICNLVAGLVFLAVGSSLAKGRVPRNHVYGFRFPKSYVSEDQWQKINRYGGRRILVWTPIVFLAALAPFIWPIDNRPYVALVLALAPCVVMIPCVRTYRFAQRLPD